MGSVWSALFGDREQDRKLMKEILKNHYAFTFATYKALTADREGDILFSSPHLQSALASLVTGAADAAEAELRAALHPPRDRRTFERGYSALAHYLHDIEGATIASATRVITPDTICLMKDYYVTSHKYFTIDIKPTNLTRPHEELRSSINHWISKNTKGFVNHLVPEGSVNTTIQMLIISAVYFKADLESPFHVSDTTNELFYVTGDPNDIRSVKLMHQVNMYHYGEFEQLQCQAVELPFKNPHMSCILLLPFTGDGLSDLEGKLSSIDFMVLLENMTKKRVKVSIPSFRNQETYDLCDYLETMGLASLMNHQKGPLKKVCECDPPMTVTQFNHQFYFELSEEISDPFERVKMSDDQLDTFGFRADHPFLFVILDKWLNMMLSFGRINCHDRFTTPVCHRKAIGQRDEQLRQYLEDEALLEEFDSPITPEDQQTPEGGSQKPTVAFRIGKEIITSEL